MDLDKAIEGYLRKPNKDGFTKKDLTELVSVIDLTTLNLNETEESIARLCKKATSSLGTVAAICVYPKFVSMVAKHAPGIKIAAVANFPTGDESLKTVLADIEKAIQSGAKEIDVVFPYISYLKGETTKTATFLKECKNACKKKKLKVILEVSEFDDHDQIYAVSQLSIDSGADFLKTSTGKSKHGATLESAAIMLFAIKSCEKKNIGFKASGGIKEISQALPYYRLAQRIMGKEWVTPAHFRIGSSSLIDNIFTAGHSAPHQDIVD